MKIGLVVFLLFILTAFHVSPGARYALANEKVIYSFVTQNGKILTLCQDTAEYYIIYRFGTKHDVQLEFPKKDEDSWTQFNYSYWLRGGGRENEGMDLNYVAFVNDGFKYVIYDTYFASENKSVIGLKVFDIKGGKVMDIRGDLKTKQGTLTGLRDNSRIQPDDTLYD